MTARRVRLIPISDIEARPAPWPHYPHCPRCHSRIVASTAKAARQRRLAHFNGADCPYCGIGLHDCHRPDNEGASP